MSKINIIKKKFESLAKTSVDKVSIGCIEILDHFSYTDGKLVI